MLCDRVGVAGGRVDDGDVLVMGVIHVDVVKTGALLADDLEVFAGVHHLGSNGFGTAHDRVGLERSKLLHISLLVIVAAKHDFKIVFLEDVGCDLIELDGVINLKLCHDQYSSNYSFSYFHAFLPLYLLSHLHYTLHVSQKQGVSGKICKILFNFMITAFCFDKHPSRPLHATPVIYHCIFPGFSLP